MIMKVNPKIKVIDPIGQSVGDFTPELQFAILQLLVNGVCETLLEHIKKTNYKYSIQVLYSIRQTVI